MSTIMRNFWTQRKWISAHSGQPQHLVFGFPEISMLNALLKVSENRDFRTLEIDEESPTRWTAIHRETRQTFVVEMTDDPPLGPKDCDHWIDKTMPCERKVRRDPPTGYKSMPEPSLLFSKPKQLDLF